MNRVALALVLLGLAALAMVVESVAAENPSAANVYAGDAYAAFTNLAGVTREFDFRIVNTAGGPAHRSGWEVAPGGSVTAFFRSDVSGGGSPPLPNGESGETCILDTYWDNTATLQHTWYTSNVCPSNGTSYAVHCTTDGTSSGSAVSGTLRLRLRVQSRTLGVTDYNLDSDTYTAKGALRCGANVSAIAVNAYPAGSTFAYTIAGETITCTATHTPAQAQQVRTATLALLDASNAAIQTNAVTMTAGATSTASGFTVSDTFPAAATSAGCQLDGFGNAVLTGVEWTHIATATAPVTEPDDGTARRASFFNVDARITATHLLQVNDAAFGSPPMSKDVGSSRYNDDIGRMATRFTNARGEGLAGASFAFTSTLQDDGLMLPPDTATGLTVSTQGGEAGWSTLRLWNDGAPLGGYTKTVDITGPATIDAASHLLQATMAYTLAMEAGGGGETIYTGADPLTISCDDDGCAVHSRFLNGAARVGAADAIFVSVWALPGYVNVIAAGAVTEVDPVNAPGSYALDWDLPAGSYLVSANTTDGATPIGAATKTTVGTDAGIYAYLVSKFGELGEPMEITTALWPLILATAFLAIMTMRQKVNYLGVGVAGLLFLFAAIATPFADTMTAAQAVGSGVIVAAIGFWLLVVSVMEIKDARGGADDDDVGVSS